LFTEIKQKTNWKLMKKKSLQHLHLQQNLLEVVNGVLAEYSESIILDIDKLSAFADFENSFPFVSK
jgi:hypothetical protein